jgi:hypothetical protein
VGRNFLILIKFFVQLVFKRTHVKVWYSGLGVFDTSDSSYIVSPRSAAHDSFPDIIENY